MKTPLIIYNLFPRLFGDISGWNQHIDRAADMHFNTVYVNPIHYPGFSGSLYAVRDYFAYNPLFFGEDNVGVQKKQFKKFISYCHKKNIKVILDLVINHTAKDADLTKEHKDWYILKNGKIQSPGVWSGDKKIIDWGDLAEIDNEHSEDRDNLWTYWKKVVQSYLDLGIDGFRCDAAYQVTNELWIELIEFARKQNKDALFLAESLGCTNEDTMKLVQAGFDYVFNSSKYWDFSEEWCLQQHSELLQLQAHSISFPESHDTQRLFKESSGKIDFVKMKYLFSCIFSTGVMTTSGFEYGFTKKTDVIKTLPSDWEDTGIDISDYIQTCNQLKTDYAIFAEDCEFKEISNRKDPVLALLKINQKTNEKALILINKDRDNYKRFYSDTLYSLMQSDQIKDLSIEYPMEETIPDKFEYWLRPSQIKILYSSTK